MDKATRNHQIPSLPIPLPPAYIQSDRQKELYQTGYVNGRLKVNTGDDITKLGVQDLDRCYLRGFFDGYLAELDYELEQGIAQDSQ